MNKKQRLDALKKLALVSEDTPQINIKQEISPEVMQVVSSLIDEVSDEILDQIEKENS